MAWQTNPNTLLSASAWYRVADLAALFGVLASRLESFLGVSGYDRVQGGQVLMQVNNQGGAGSWNYIPQSGETAGTVAAFEAVDQK